ncbi:MAG TPA: hypothetical protein VK553_12170 [Candidatus Nitrosopolaris rasttigaisensis]|nr:hypothetical protein [Candidatus Nitrosopolaris rasttigaisensis]
MRSNKCSKCKEVKETESKRYCRKCHAAYVREWRKNHSLNEEQRFKNNVRRKTNMRILRGKLKKLPCQVCGTSEKVEAHHHDYNKTYDVRWLCFTHHREHHKMENFKAG